MKDYRASVEKLRKDAAEAALIRDLATDQLKRDMYDSLHRQLNALADEVEQAIKSSAAKQGGLRTRVLERSRDSEKATGPSPSIAVGADLT